MNILVLAPHPFFQDRGTPIAVRSVVEILASAGNRVDLLTYHEGHDVTIPGVRLHRIPALRGIHGIPPGFSVKKVVCDVALAGRCVSLLRRRQFDVLHAVEESAFIALAAKRLYGVPYVYDMDSSLAQQMMERFPALRAVRPLLLASERRAIRGSAGVIAVCRALEDAARACAPGKLVARIEDASLLAPDAGVGKPAFTGIARPIVLYVGNLEPYQGIDLLLQGFAGAASAGAHGSLVIVGGTERHIDAYRARAGALGIAERVHFFGSKPVSMLGRFLGQADVLVSPRARGFNTPMKIYSYLDSGTPIVATRLPTHTQVLDDEIACLVEPRPEALGAGLLALLRDPERARRLGERARLVARREFTPEALRRKLLDFYSRLAEQLGHAPLREAADVR